MIPAVVGPEWLAFGLFLVLAGLIMMAMGNGFLEYRNCLADVTTILLMCGGGGAFGTGVGIVMMNAFFAFVTEWQRQCGMGC